MSGLRKIDPFYKKQTNGQNDEYDRAIKDHIIIPEKRRNPVI
jgi:hypothetical protein